MSSEVRKCFRKRRKWIGLDAVKFTRRFVQLDRPLSLSSYVFTDELTGNKESWRINCCLVSSSHGGNTNSAELSQHECWQMETTPKTLANVSIQH